jgi:hypothetical protein
MLRRPILGLTPADGASAELLRSVGCPIVEPTDAPAIEATLRQAFQNWKQSGSAFSAPATDLAGALGIPTIAAAFEDALDRAIGADHKQ